MSLCWISVERLIRHRLTRVLDLCSGHPRPPRPPRPSVSDRLPHLHRVSLLISSVHSHVSQRGLLILLAHPSTRTPQALAALSRAFPSVRIVTSTVDPTLELVQYSTSSSSSTSPSSASGPTDAAAATDAEGPRRGGGSEEKETRGEGEVVAERAEWVIRPGFGDIGELARARVVRPSTAGADPPPPPVLLIRRGQPDATTRSELELGRHPPRIRRARYLSHVVTLPQDVRGLERAGPSRSATRPPSD